MDKLDKLLTPLSSARHLHYQVEQAHKTTPEYAFENVCREIVSFERTLSETEAVGCYLASFGQSILLNIRSVSLSGQFICMEGITNDGNDARLIQHFTQTSILLIKMKSEEPRHPIGFLRNP